MPSQSYVPCCRLSLMHIAYKHASQIGLQLAKQRYRLAIWLQYHLRMRGGADGIFVYVFGLHTYP